MKFELQSTNAFDQWLIKQTGTTKIQILSRLARAENGHFGDHKALSLGLFELRCFFGGGIRIYYALRNNQVILLIAGGNKSSQNKDIQKALQLLTKLEIKDD